MAQKDPELRIMMQELLHYRSTNADIFRYGFTLSGSNSYSCVSLNDSCNRLLADRIETYMECTASPAMKAYATDCVKCRVYTLNKCAKVG